MLGRRYLAGAEVGFSMPTRVFVALGIVAFVVLYHHSPKHSGKGH